MRHLCANIAPVNRPVSKLSFGHRTRLAAERWVPTHGPERQLKIWPENSRLPPRTGRRTNSSSTWSMRSLHWWNRATGLERRARSDGLGESESGSLYEMVRHACRSAEDFSSSSDHAVEQDRRGCERHRSHRTEHSDVLA